MQPAFTYFGRGQKKKGCPASNLRGIINPAYPYLRKGEQHSNSVNTQLPQKLKPQKWPPGTYLATPLGLTRYQGGSKSAYQAQGDKPPRQPSRGPFHQENYLLWIT